MREKMNNRGMTLVELIIVIAILAVLVGFLAPQYLKYVHNSKVSTDIHNAQEIARSCDAAFSEGLSGFGVGDTPSALPGGDAFPPSRVNGATDWVVTIDNNGVSTITLDGKVIYPEPKVSGGYYTVLHQ